MSTIAPLRIGILGAANIARAFTRGVAGSAQAQVVAVASRGAEKAQAFAAELGIPRALPSYEALLADAEVEAVYIPLPNDLHAEWAIRACAAGKHVLCEKPIAIGEADARAMFQAARRHGVVLREAYPYMAQSQTVELRRLLQGGAIGRVQMITAAFGFRLVSPEGAPLGDAANIRLLPDRGGGALLDAGTYAVSLARIAAGERPLRAQAALRRTTTGVDAAVAATLEFPSGAIAQVNCSMATAAHRHALIAGDAGVIETTYANHALPGLPTLPLRIRRGVQGTIPMDVLDLPAGDGFRAEAESFAALVRTGAGWTGASEQESLDIAATLAAIAASAPTGAWADI
jgi:predicted dehydrogenase